MSVKKTEIEIDLQALQEEEQRLLKQHTSIKDAMTRCENEVLMNRGAQRHLRNKYLTKLPPALTPPIPAPKKTSKKPSEKK